MNKKEQGGIIKNKYGMPARKRKGYNLAIPYLREGKGRERLKAKEKSDG